jgi:DNA-directed RNA polymerase specialized sigma24 family protein
VPQFRIADAAPLLGVSDDTVRRWVDAGARRGRHQVDERLVETPGGNS